MPIPPEFSEALRSLSLWAIEQAQRLMKQGAHIPVRTFQVPVQHGPGAWSSEYREHPLPYVLLYDFRDKLMASPEYGLCERIMRGTPVIARHLNQRIGLGNVSSQLDVYGSLNSFLAHQWEGQAVPSFRESVFRAADDDLQTFFTKDEIEYEAWVPLENLECPDTPVHVSPTIAVLRTPAEVFETVFPIEEMMYRFLEVVQWGSVLHLEFTSLKTVGDSSPLPD